MTEETLEWQAWDNHHGERKSARWFLGIGIGALALIAIAIWTSNFLLAILVIIAAFTLALHHHKGPALVTYALTPRGVRIDDRLYPYENLNSFWLEEWVVATPEQGGHWRLRFDSSKALLPHLTLPLPEAVDNTQVKAYLLAFLPEERHDESLIEALAEFLGL